MTNKTITLSRELVEQIHKELTSGAVSIGTGSQVRAALASQHVVCSAGILCQNRECKECGGNGSYIPPLADPVPPAGGDVKVLGYSVKGNRYAIRLTKAELLDLYEGYTGDALVELVDRAHVTRLQAEVAEEKRLRACAQGSNAAWGMTVGLAETLLDDPSYQLHGLDWDYEHTIHGKIAALQAALTKARECLNTLQSAVFLMIDNSGDADDPGDITIMRHDFDKLCELVPEDWQGLDSNQSAPADKGQGEPVTVESELLRAFSDYAKQFTFKNHPATPNMFPIGFPWFKAGFEAGHAGQPAPVAVVMPERMEIPSEHAPAYVYRKGWNACLDELARLNSEPKP